LNGYIAYKNTFKPKEQPAPTEAWVLCHQRQSDKDPCQESLVFSFKSNMNWEMWPTI